MRVVELLGGDVADEDDRGFLGHRTFLRVARGASLFVRPSWYLVLAKM
jgi:hypothetical protein